MWNNKKLWIGLSLANLCVVALLGFILRSKILFPLPAVDYRHVLSAHSHFAFGGWAGLCLMTLLVFYVLPAHRNKYAWILLGIEATALGMALSFPFGGYGRTAIISSSLYIVFSWIFSAVYLHDLFRQPVHPAVRLLLTGALVSLILSAIGPILLAYIMASHSTDSILYRDSVYLFLHFQYNGFFTLSVVALLFHHLLQQGVVLQRDAWRFAALLTISVLPALYLSLLWHGEEFYYAIAAVGAVLILWAAVHALRFFSHAETRQPFVTPMARWLWSFSLFSFAGKMLLQLGTLIPSLGHAIYSDRPVIIGFLHLVFLGFISFFLLAFLLEQGLFRKHNRSMRLPFIVFAAGIFANEALLMFQGLEILFKSNSNLYNWFLWGAAILLLGGALMLAISYVMARRHEKAIHGVNG